MKNLRVGDVIETRFVIQKEVARGGSTTVYRALDLKIEDTFVAVKAFDRDAHLPKIQQEFFRREVSALAELKHPNIVRIITSSVGTDLIPAFIALEWVPRDLVSYREAKASHTFEDWDSFIEQIGLPVLDAIAFAHQRGCVHRDIKPANILIDIDGSPKLADFGISKLKCDLQPRVTLQEFASRPFAPPEADTGERMFSRDVFGFAAVAIWSLSNRHLTSYAELMEECERLGVPREAKDLLLECISRDPMLRPESGLALRHRLKAIHAKRALSFISSEFPIITLALTNTARAQLALIRGVDAQDRGGMNAFVEADLRDAPRVTADKGVTLDQRAISSYWLYGGEWTYRIAPNIQTNGMAVTQVKHHEVDALIKRKSEARVCHARFKLTPILNALSTDESVELLDADLVSASHDDSCPIDTLLASWGRTLELREAFAKDAVPDVRYDGIQCEPPLVTLLTVASVDTISVEQPWRIPVDGKAPFRGEVFKVSPGRITLYLRDGDATSIPKSGTAQLDLGALKTTLIRQQEAIDRVKTRTATRADFGELVFQPKLSALPKVTAVDAREHSSLDASQHIAYETALATNDFLLVEGPPGTGKTRFISHLIAEEVLRFPRIRILLTSQTHVAIDNALDAVHRVNPKMPLLRICRRGSTRVAATSDQFLLDAQLSRWKRDVTRESSRTLQTWAESNGLDYKKLVIGSRLQQILSKRTLLSKYRAEIKRIQELAGYHQADPVLEAEEDEARISLESEKAELETLYLFFKQIPGEFDKKVRDASEEDLSKLVTSYLPQSEPLAGQARQRMELQTEWIQRFGRDDSFTELLCCEVNVVAATCLGLAQVESNSPLEFDLCIMDEAGKAHATEALVPLCKARRWILVGDPNQLPPFEDEALRTQEYRERFDITDEAVEPLFDRLLRLVPRGCKTRLSKQYRMVPPIGSMVSNCFYDGKLENSDRKPDPLLGGILGCSLAWLTTNKLSDRREVSAGLSFVNPCEIQKVLELLGDFQTALSGSDRKVEVLCISGYGAQVQALQKQLNAECSSFPNLVIECNTIDAIQGREASVVIFSVVRSNPNGRVGFLREFRRINVALSRARDVLAIVGDHQFVEQATDLGALQSVLTYIKAEPDGVQMQVFEPKG